MTPAMRIRAASELDAEAIRDVLVQTWHATYDATMGADEVTRITDAWHAVDRLRAQCVARDSVFLVAELDERLVGVATGRRVRREPERLRTIDRLYVLPPHQGRGLGTKLLEALIDRLDGSGPLRLEADYRNTEAIAFYTRRGFVPVGRVDDDVTMELRPEHGPP